jgi:hypothetical protein
MSLGLILTGLLAGVLQGPIPPPPPPSATPIRVNGTIPETGESLIEGIVRRLDTGAPLPEARVRLTGLPDRTGALSIREVLTGADGRFAIRNIPASTYNIRVSRENYFATNIGGVSAAAVTVSVNTAANKTSDLSFGLTPGGVISGVARDGDGRPMPKVSVSAFRIVYRDGRKTLETVKGISSDDRGEFRLFGLPPGEYYLRANGIYYPGVAEVELAMLISVRGADETFADLRIVPIKTFRISGTVVNAIPELASDPAYFALVPRNVKVDDGYSGSMYPNVGSDRGRGTFAIDGVRPGIYDFFPGAATLPELAALPAASGRSLYYTGRVMVEVRDRDVDGVSVTVTRGSSLSVHVNATAAPSATSQSVRLGLRPVDVLSIPMMASNMAARPLPADGNIQFIALPEGTYAVVSPVTTPGVYIGDIRQGARSIYDQGVITVGKDSAEPVEVVLAADGGRVEGRVEGVDKNSDTVRVSLVPEGLRRENLLLYKRAPLTEGRFVLTDISPGSYKLYAWEDLPIGADENAEFMMPFENRGRAVTVRAGVASADVVLPLIRR